MRKPMLIFFLLSCLQGFTLEQTPPPVRAPVTDADEARAVNSIFRKWNISSSMSLIKWNTSGDICDGVMWEGGGDVNNYNQDKFNPGIVCDCRMENGTVCHVTRLKALNMNITGRLPMELESLIHLNNLEIGKNYFTGPLPAYIGNFSKMMYLSIGFNSFSGEVPKELGRLSNLKSLGMGLNSFTGSLPPDLGNITGLEQMYIDNMGVTGGIPSSFANFKKLRFMFAADNNYGEKLPNFLGNLTSLEILRLQGNSFQGPIPSSFSNLVSLTELRLSNLLNESSSLSFVENMTHLSKLVLRDSRISGVIPSYIGLFRNLTYVDLSFNNLSGQLPQSLFSLPKLVTLHLGNNSFSGALPAEKSDQLVTIDLSYNDLSGSLPSWTATDNLQLNLVANNFDSNSKLPGRLRCLQKNFPCYRGSPGYYSFAVNCGGDDLELPDGTTYESDNDNITSASYFINDNLRWAVSSVGTYYDATDRQYQAHTSSNIVRASLQELFQSARTSPSSLRYYGLALENGNYTVTLNFAEIAFIDMHSWLSLGKRIFDIYIQTILVEKDFDIRKVAGDKSFTAVTKNYTALVTDNFLEIHFFWAGKGTCCIPTEGYYGPLVSAISVTPDFKPTVRNRLPKKKNKALVPGILAGIAATLLLVLILGFFILRQRKVYDAEEDFRGLPIPPNCFSFIELKTATNNFNVANKLGQGGFGSVFKGTLADGRLVAIKQLLATVQGKKQFATEVATISAIQHRNLVKLYGCCYEGTNRLLVYEYMENNSVYHALFEKRAMHLDWHARYGICIGTARGLAYLHEESNTRIVHRDIKASNILLDANLTPKISDFGLAKLYDDGMTHITTRIAGTFGYLAPEYAMRGILTEKVDVFGFGIVVLEILSGRTNVELTPDGTKVYLLEWAWDLFEKHQYLEILDPSLPWYDKEQALRMIQLAFLCTQMNPGMRPAMSRVVAILDSTLDIRDDIVKPAYLREWDTDEHETSYLLTFATATGNTSSIPMKPSATSLSASGRYIIV